MISSKSNAECRLPVFRDKLKTLQGNMPVKDFAAKLGLSRQTLAFYLMGERIPDAATLLQICEKCDVSADYLLGLSETTHMKDHSLESECANYLGLSRESIRHLHAWNSLSSLLKNSEVDNATLVEEDEKCLEQVSEYETMERKLHCGRNYFRLIDSIIGGVSVNAYSILAYYNDFLLAKTMKLSRKVDKNKKYGDLIGPENTDALLRNGFQVISSEKAFYYNWRELSDILFKEINLRAPKFLVSDAPESKE